MKPFRTGWRVVTAALIAPVAVPLIAVAGGTSTDAAAAQPCSGNDSNYFDGYYYNTGVRSDYSYEGTSSYITVQSGTPCTNGPSGAANASLAWVMIAKTGLKYGQVGYVRRSGESVMRYFAQWNDGGFSPQTDYYSTTVAGQIGVRHAFRVIFDLSCRCHVGKVDNVVISQSPFNLYNVFGAQPWSPEYAGETIYPESDVPGTGNDPASYTALGAQRYDNDVVEALPCILTARKDVSRWAQQASSCRAFDIWTAQR